MHDDREPQGDDRPATNRQDGQTERFLQSMPATLWTTDRDLVLTFIHGVYLRRLGVRPETLVGKSIPSLLLDGRDDHPLIEAHTTALGGHESTVRIEWGGRLYTARLAPLRTGDGQIAGCAGILVEIGWIADEESTLRESEVRLQRAVDANISGIVFGDDEGRVIDANDAFLAMTGYTRDDIVDERLSWPALTPVDCHQRQIHALQEIVTDGRCAPFESVLIHKDGTRVPVLIAAVRLSARKREGVAFVLDLTDRERRLRRAAVELACADAIIASPQLPAAGDTMLDALTTELACRAGALWSATPDGCRLIARRGDVSASEPAFDSLAERVLATRTVCWADADDALGVPLDTDGQCYGALILAGWRRGRPDADELGLCTRVAARVARFIASRPARPPAAE